MMHVGMINSYNVLTGSASVEMVVNSGIGVFAHVPDEDISLEGIEFMIFYFKELEMYEKCAKLQDYIEKTYKSDGSFKEERCVCEYPEIGEYVSKIKCSVCNLIIRK